jgi:hypothetical protein
MVDLGTIQHVVGAVIDVIFVINQANPCYPVPRLLRPVSVRMIACIACLCCVSRKQEKYLGKGYKQDGIPG